MRVLHINANYLYTNLHQHMARALSEYGVDNHVFVPLHTRNNIVVTPDENVKVSVCYKKWDRFFFYKKQKKIEAALEASINVSEFDLLHAYTLFTDGNCAYKLSKKYNIPYVVAIRNTDVNTFFKRRPLLRGRGVEILANAKAVFFLSEPYKKQVLNKYIPADLQGALEAKSYVIPNGIDDFWLRNLQTNSDREVHTPLRLVFAGRIDANKNIPAIQRAMRLLREKKYETHLTVVGRVADKSVFRRITADQYTTYIPPKDKTELMGIYRENDVFVMPSHTESFGLAYAEAMSQGLPVIYTKGQGFDGQFSEGEVGYSVDSHSPEVVAEGIVKTIERYGEISNSCLKNAVKFQWISICKIYQSIYRIICGEQDNE